MSHELVLQILIVLAVAPSLLALVSFAIAWPRAVRRARARVAPTPAPAPRRALLESEPDAVPAARPPRAAPPTSAAAAPPAAPDWNAGLKKTRLGFVAKLERLLGGRSELDADTLDEIETVLFGADIGVRSAESLMDAARAAGSPGAVRPALCARALEMLAALPDARVERTTTPHVILVVGVNGAGKTTTIGKLAARATRAGEGVVLAAGDTYRAAAIDQLAVWAERAGAELVRGQPGGDPAAVAFDAVKAASARDAELCIIDTAGRLQTDAGLMDELAKLRRVVQKELPDAPHEVLLVLDANTGQNAIRQAQEFSRVVNVTGIVLTKLDGTAKGGVVLGIAEEVGLPVRYVGLGEGIDDLVDFAPEPFVQALFAPAEPGT